MSENAARSAHIDEIPHLGEGSPNEPIWKPIRLHFGIQGFGVNAWVAHVDGESIIERHTEVEDSGTRHEELYFVSSGHATFTVGGETIEAPSGSFVFVRDPETVRAATARTAGTTVLVVGATPGEAFTPSAWEMKHAG